MSEIWEWKVLQFYWRENGSSGRKLDHIYFFHYKPQMETAVTQWLRYCATNRKVAGSIPDGVIGIFHWRNPSDRTMTLGSTQSLTEMSTKNISWR